MVSLNIEAAKGTPTHSTDELHKIYDLAYCKQRTFDQKYSPHDRGLDAVAAAVRSERPSGAPPITSIEKAIVEAVIAWRRQFPRDKTGNLGIFMEPIAKAADDWLASLRPIPERPVQQECWIVYNKLGRPPLSYYWSEESAVDAANNIGGSWRHVPARPAIWE